MKYTILTLFLPQILSQYVADLDMKPDVTFGDQNDRFDLTSLMEDRTKYNIDPLDQLDELASSQEYRRYENRRSGSQKRNVPKRGIGENDQKRVRIGRRSDLMGPYSSNFAYHDDIDIGEGGSLSDFEENLERFKGGSRRAQDLIAHLHGTAVKTWRRSNGEPGNTDAEVLLHYAVPVEMTVNGYLKVPVV